MPKRFTKEELSNIVNDYYNSIPLFKLSEKYGRKPEVILAKLRSIGIYENKTIRWSNEELEILKNNYSTTDWDVLLNLLYRHNKEDIITKASKLGIKRERYFWSEEDIDILKNSYSKGLSLKDIENLLNGKFNQQSIATKANKLGIVKIKKWTDEETDIMKKYYSSIPLDEICKLLPNRKRDNIIAKAKNLNIKSYEYLQKHWSEEDLEFLMSNYKNMTDEEIANALNRSINSIRGKRDCLKLLRPVEKGVYDYLSEYIRKRNKQWKKDSIKNCGYQCVITKGRFQAIHHLYGMNLILKETLEELSMIEKEHFEDYTENELNIIVNKFYEVQSRYPLGLCLSKEIHKDFHDKYGYGNNTPEQFEKYLKENNLKIA